MTSANHHDPSNRPYETSAQGRNQVTSTRWCKITAGKGFHGYRGSEIKRRTGYGHIWRKAVPSPFDVRSAQRTYPPFSGEEPDSAYRVEDIRWEAACRIITDPNLGIYKTPSE